MGSLSFYLILVANPERAMIVTKFIAKNDIHSFFCFLAFADNHLSEVWLLVIPHFNCSHEVCFIGLFDIANKMASHAKRRHNHRVEDIASRVSSLESLFGKP